VILDRDGVINEDSDEYIKSADEWIPIEGSIEAICDLSRGGFTVAVATNQSGIARDYFDEYTLAKIHQKMCSAVEEAGGFIDGIFFCPHAPDANCNCRKPKTGLLEAISTEFGVPLNQVPFVGDSLKDIEAARAVSCQPILVKTGKGIKTIAALTEHELDNLTVVSNLKQAVSSILEFQ
jgi:D-glycero-D-manno-heptose 1,7-bisphosphate phosphatase